MTEASTPEIAEPTLAELLPLGWAPGQYAMRCPDCGAQEWNGAKRRIRCRACATALWGKPQVSIELAQAVAATDPRQIIVAVLRRMKATGESHEMAARWIMEEFRRHGFEVITNG